MKLPLLMIVASLFVHSAVAADSSTNRVMVPFEVKRGHVMVQALLNGSNALAMMVDSAYEMTMIHPELAERLALNRRGRMTIVGIAGEEPADVFSGTSFHFGPLIYSPRRVAALRSDTGRRGREGILGTGFFRRFVVEIQPPAKSLILHEPRSFEYSGSGQIVPLTVRRGGTPVVDATIILAGGRKVPGRFEIDTGCDGGLCLGRDFVRTNGLIEAAGGTRASGRSGVGGGTDSREGTLPEVQLGSVIVLKPQTHFFTEGSPVDAGFAGHIGWDVFRTFKTVIFDYGGERLILEPGSEHRLEPKRQ